MEKNYFQRVQEQTQTRFWINNVTRRQAELAISAGAVGCTQNPAYVWKMISDEEEGGHANELLKSIIKTESDDDAVEVKAQRSLVGEIAKQFHPLFASSNGKYGFVSIQGNPHQEDRGSIIEFARFNRCAGENIMAKIPVTEEGLAAMEVLIRENIPINATECMAARQVLDVCQLYERVTKNMVRPAPMYYSVITGIFDEYIYKTVQTEQIPVPADYLYQAGMSVAKRIYSLVKQEKYDCHYISGGARGLQHFTEMVGADCAVTINWSGTADRLLNENAPVVSRFFNPVPQQVLDDLCEKIPDFKRAYFINGIEPEEYEEYGPVVLFRASFETAWDNSIKHIKALRKGQ